MKKVVLIFPDTENMADFILNQEFQTAEVNSVEQTVTAIVTDLQLEVAQTVYGATVRSSLSEV